MAAAAAAAAAFCSFPSNYFCPQPSVVQT